MTRIRLDTHRHENRSARLFGVTAVSLLILIFW